MVKHRKTLIFTSNVEAGEKFLAGNSRNYFTVAVSTKKKKNILASKTIC